MVSAELGKEASMSFNKVKGTYEMALFEGFYGKFQLLEHQK